MYFLQERKEWFLAWEDESGLDERSQVEPFLFVAAGFRVIRILHMTSGLFEDAPYFDFLSFDFYFIFIFFIFSYRKSILFFRDDCVK